MQENKGCHIIVDTLGLVIAVEGKDRDSVLGLFVQAKEKAPKLQRFFANQGYTGKLQSHCLLKTRCLLTITKKVVDTGF